MHVRPLFDHDAVKLFTLCSLISRLVVVCNLPNGRVVPQSATSPTNQSCIHARRACVRFWPKHQKPVTAHTAECVATPPGCVRTNQTMPTHQASTSVSLFPSTHRLSLIHCTALVCCSLQHTESKLRSRAVICYLRLINPCT